MTQLPRDLAKPARGELPRRAPGLTARERLGLAVLAAEQARRGVFARMRLSRLLRWRYRSPQADDLLLAPPDLRVADPSFAEELSDGTMGLAGAIAHVGSSSLFRITPPSPEWARELHGFGWLRHLGVAAASPRAQTLARDLVLEWIAGSQRRRAPAWAPDVVARRVMSWLAHAGILLDGVERRPYVAIMKSLEDQVTYLTASWRNAPDGYPRLLAVIGLVAARLCVAGQERRLDAAEEHLVRELSRQILDDGGHISRNPQVTIELLLDLLPLRQCFTARGRPPHPVLAAAIASMTEMLRHLRLGDGSIARFNGMGATERDTLSTLLAYHRSRLESGRTAPPSGYVRLERGDTVAIADAGAPPPLALAGQACAGCLSFELTCGSEPLIVNAGAPASARPGTSRAVSRATASHNTLCLGEQSSSKLIRNARLERQIGAPPIRNPTRVTCDLAEREGVLVLDASHDGYVADFGLIHARRLSLAADGRKLAGEDRLTASKGILRFSWDVPFAVHFHLHPEVQVDLAGGAAELLLPSGACWRLTAEGAAMSIEGSRHFAEAAGPRQARQVVLRAVCCGEAEVTWTLERIADRPAESPSIADEDA
jgi:uncharacterized heparinase superfamily protein